MRFTIIIAALTTLSTTASACRCILAGDPSKFVTRYCCAQMQGKFYRSGDCLASSIHDMLWEFSTCCLDTMGTISDCPCKDCWAINGPWDPEKDPALHYWVDEQHTDGDLPPPGGNGA